MYFNFEISKNKILPQIYIIKYSKFTDLRGYNFSFYDLFLEKKLYSITKKKFIHDKFSFRKKNVITGIHGDNKTWKLITCLKGKIIQVIVNCNVNSKNFGKHIKLELDEKSFKSVLIPPNYGNAFLSRGKENLYYYKLAYTGRYVDNKNQFTYKWNDPKFNIKWPIKNPILSKRDS